MDGSIEMNTQDKIKVMQAAVDGKEIEVKMSGGEWLDIYSSSGLGWNWGTADYRIKRKVWEPKQKLRPLTFSGNAFSANTEINSNKLQELINGQARLFSWVSDHDGLKEFEMYRSNYYVYYSPAHETYSHTWNDEYKATGIIYMTKACAIATAKALNSKKLVL